MYSPKISENLIPEIYRVAKLQKIPMTRWVNQVLKQALVQISDGGILTHIVGNGVASSDSNNVTNHSS
jgi:hypothetical protein